jgi:WD40 repeat protein
MSIWGVFSTALSSALMAACSWWEPLIKRAACLQEVAGFKKRKKWTREKCGSINRARWIGNKRIIAVYGDLVVYELGQKKPVLHIAPNAGSSILDIDISQDGQYAFCGSDDNLVFKVAIRENAPVQWKHEGHSSWVTSVRLSGNQRHVLSGDIDSKAVLASSEDGSILAAFSLSNGVYKGLSGPETEEHWFVLGTNWFFSALEKMTALWRGCLESKAVIWDLVVFLE